MANDVTQPGAGFDVDTNMVTLLFRDAREEFVSREQLPKMSKFDVATRVLDEIVRLRSVFPNFRGTIPPLANEF